MTRRPRGASQIVTGLCDSLEVLGGLVIEHKAAFNVHGQSRFE